jgi:hypothetical protein
LKARLYKSKAKAEPLSALRRSRWKAEPNSKKATSPTSTASNLCRKLRAIVLNGPEIAAETVEDAVADQAEVVVAGIVVEMADAVDPAEVAVAVVATAVADATKAINHEGDEGTRRKTCEGSLVIGSRGLRVLGFLLDPSW